MPSCTRRGFLALSGSILAGSSLAALGAGCGNATPRGPLPEGTLLSASNDVDGSYRVKAMTTGGLLAFESRIPVRGHGAAVQRYGVHTAIVARRPGEQVFIVNRKTGARVQTLQASPGRHYLGHAAYDPQDRFLYVTENCYDDALLPDFTPIDSVIGVYDVQRDYERVAELPTYGVGAHELLVSPDGATLIIANGGIYTHPAKPREKLNLDSMDPSLVWVDVMTGALLEQQRLGDARLSMRHLAVASDQSVVVASQHTDETAAPMPLLTRHQRGAALREFRAHAAIWQRLANYIASCSVHAAAGVLAATSPVGGLVVFWDVASGDFLASIEATDCAGVTVIEDCFVITTGLGTLLFVDAYDLSVRGDRQAIDTRWDNHCVALPA